MFDLFLAVTTILGFLYLVLYLGTGDLNPIKQFKFIFEKKDILLGVAVVLLITVLILGLTNKAEAFEYEFELGLDQPIGSNNIGCVIEGDQTASNITLRALKDFWYLSYGVSYNHQSCAANEDWRTSDRIGLTAISSYNRYRLEISAQTWEDKQVRMPITFYADIYSVGQYTLASFIQKQYGTYEESSRGLALNWKW